MWPLSWHIGSGLWSLLVCVCACVFSFRVPHLFSAGPGTPLHGCAQHTVPFGIGEVRKDWFFYFTLEIIIMTPLTLFTCTSCQSEPISSSLSHSAASSATGNTAQTFITVIFVPTPAQASVAALGSDTCQKQLLSHATSSWHQSS